MLLFIEATVFYKIIAVGGKTALEVSIFHYDWLKAVFKNWCFQFMTTFLYYNDLEEYGEDAINREAYKLGLASFPYNAPTYHIELRDHPVLVWDFHSLLLAIQMLFTLMVTDETTPLRMCRNCQRAFFAKRRDSVFCSAECRKKYGSHS